MAAPLVLLVDDHPLFRDGFGAMVRALRPGWRLRCADTAAQAVASVVEDVPQLVVIDISLPDEDGFALSARLGALDDPPAMLIVSAREDEAARVRARASGLRGFVSKGATPQALAEAMDVVLAGGTAFDAAARPEALPTLTARQAQVLALLAEGHGNKEIRYRLDIAERTVRAHLTELFQLLGAHSRTHAIIRARRLGLID